MCLVVKGFPSGSVVKNLAAVQEPQETWVQSLDQEDSLAEDVATHFSIPAWRTPWTEEPGGPQPIGSQRVRHDRSDLAYTKLGAEEAIKPEMPQSTDKQKSAFSRQTIRKKIA